MKSRSLFLAAAGLFLALLPVSAQEDAQIWYSWSPKPAPITPWKSPNKPIWRLAEIMASHKSRMDWDQPIVRDQDYAADYISLGAGSKTKPQFWADDRIFWYVASGQIRFHIQGQDPFVASKGWMVQVPLSQYLLDGDGGKRAQRAPGSDQEQSHPPHPGHPA